MLWGLTDHLARIKGEGSKEKGEKRKKKERKKKRG